MVNGCNFRAVEIHDELLKTKTFGRYAEGSSPSRIGFVIDFLGPYYMS